MVIDSSNKAKSVLYEVMGNLDVEEIWAIALSTNMEAIESKMLFRGTLNSCHFHPRDLFRFLYMKNAAGFIIFHNHPSGNANPTRVDLIMTRRLLTMSMIAEVPLKDHIIISKDSYFSFADHNLLKPLKSVSEQLHLEISEFGVR